MGGGPVCFNFAEAKESSEEKDNSVQCIFFKGNAMPFICNGIAFYQTRLPLQFSRDVTRNRMMVLSGWVTEGNGHHVKNRMRAN